ncbi:transmembrane protein, putative [Babesia ovis]|uniref:Transmembrane protein, putative n=1 Tax=Babesia ovis TaxID=5869 RepID=A0A9W5TBA3_BABOV|nr:transmembrane protein, putative [Babesia ovis]
MTQGAKQERATSGYPDWYLQFHPHDCDVECLFNSLFQLIVCSAIFIVVTRYLYDMFNYKTSLALQLIDQDIKQSLHDLGHLIIKNQYVGPYFAKGHAQLSRLISDLMNSKQQLAPILKLVKAYNTETAWEFIFAIGAILLVYYICTDILRRIGQYFHERKLLYFCVNMRPVEAHHNKAYTKKMVSELMKSPEYLRLKHQRMNQGPEAWNWQTRQRLGEPMPSDYLSEDDM